MRRPDDRPQGGESWRSTSPASASCSDLKTGALIRFSCEAGCILGRRSDSDRQALLAYGDKLGLAFQISDDLLDVRGDQAAVGKDVGNDAEARPPSSPRSASTAPSMN